MNSDSLALRMGWLRIQSSEISALASGLLYLGTRTDRVLLTVIGLSLWVKSTHYCAAASLSASPQLAESIRVAKRFRVVPIVLQKSFCTGDQNFFWLYTRFSCKDVGDLIA
jgi:hypothetical protein